MCPLGFVVRLVFCFTAGFVASFTAFSILKEERFRLPKAHVSSTRRAHERTVLMKNVTGIARTAISFLVPISSLNHVSLYVRATEARAESFVFLIDSWYGVVLLDGGAKLKIIWGKGMELTCDLPKKVDWSSFRLLSFLHQPSEHRLSLFFDRKQFFSVLGFDPQKPSSKHTTFWLGCPPAYQSVGSHLLFAHVSVELFPRESISFPPAEAASSWLPLESLESLVDAIRLGAPLPRSLFSASFDSFVNGCETTSMHFCAVANALSDDSLDSALCAAAYGSARRGGGLGMRANAEVALGLLKLGSSFAFRAWQREGLRETVYYSPRRRHELAMDGMVEGEEDEMIEVEMYKNSDEWLGDVYYNGKRGTQPDLAKASKHYWAANTTKAKLQLARMHFQGQRLLDNRTFRVLLEEAFSQNSSDAANCKHIFFFFGFFFGFFFLKLGFWFLYSINHY
jgi:hypothetical protein